MKQHKQRNRAQIKRILSAQRLEQATEKATARGLEYNVDTYLDALGRVLRAFEDADGLILSARHVQALFLGMRRTELDRRVATQRVNVYSAGLDRMAQSDCEKARDGAHAWRFRPDEKPDEPGRFACELCEVVA